MKYFKHYDEELFYQTPEEFNKYVEKDILKYAVGANLYMNGTKNFFEKIVNRDFKELGTISVCFEDATKDSEVEFCEDNVVSMLDKLNAYVNENEGIKDNIPLIFFRIRNYNQFVNFTNKLKKEHFKFITGFNLPKFNSKNGESYLKLIDELRNKHGEVLYAMPIIESEEVIYKETRLTELVSIKNIISKYKDIVLNIRVGGTDFSSKFGLRRSLNSNVYNIRVVSECLIDIVNMFLRENEEYVVSAAVWEYFSNNIDSKEVQGLIDEIKNDKENGFCGKTIIHPSQIKYVNSSYAVTYEEYTDAYNIVKGAEDGGVFKGYGGNKMNEIRPHYNWAKKIIARGKVFGVLNQGISNEDLYREEVLCEDEH